MFIINIKGYPVPTETLKEWEKRLIPRTEWFYFHKRIPGIEMSPLTSSDLSKVPLDIRTSYGTWSLCSETEYYIKMNPKDFTDLHESIQSEIIIQQWKARRGLVFKLEELIELSGKERRSLPAVSTDDYKEIVLLHQPLWESFDHSERLNFLVNYGSLWVDQEAVWENLEGNCQKEIIEKYPHLQNKIDRFPVANGPNCLAAVAAAFTGDETFFDSWMKEAEFLKIISKSGYEPIETVILRENDVLIWFNEANRVIHSCIVLNSQYAFNKQGQTMFNPWQILKITDIIDSWNHPATRFILYRKPK